MKRTILIAMLAFAAIIALWQATYPDQFDPKGLHYVLWKWHLLPMDPHRALSIMFHDNYAEDLVLGMSQQELERRFGFVRTVDQVSPYLRDYCAAARPGADVLFLNSNDMMVVMRKGKAAELVVCKG